MGNFSIDRVTSLIIGVVMAVVFLVVGVYLGPTVITYFGWVNATALADVELGSVVVLFASFGSLFYYLTIIGGAIVMLVAAARAAAD